MFTTTNSILEIDPGQNLDHAISFFALNNRNQKHHIHTYTHTPTQLEYSKTEIQRHYTKLNTKHFYFYLSLLAYNLCTHIFTGKFCCTSGKEIHLTSYPQEQINSCSCSRFVFWATTSKSQLSAILISQLAILQQSNYTTKTEIGTALYYSQACKDLWSTLESQKPGAKLLRLWKLDLSFQ